MTVENGKLLSRRERTLTERIGGTEKSSIRATVFFSFFAGWSGRTASERVRKR
jgi:hypothetical protein